MSIMPLKGAMPIRPASSPEENDKKLKEVSAMYEKQFLKEMLKSMRETVPENGFIKVNQAEKIFREQLDDQYVDSWSQQGGVGIADMIHKQLIDNYGERMGLKQPIQKPKGPINMDEHSNFTGHRVAPAGAESGRRVTYKFDRAPQAEAELKQPGLGSGLGDQALKAAWDGVISGSQKLGSDQYLVQMQHENGLKSQFVFRGLPSPGLSSGGIQAGQTLGILSPEAKSFYWTVEGTAASVKENGLPSKVE